MLNEFIPRSFDPEKKLKSVARVIDVKEIEKWCMEAMKKNPQAIEDFKAGEKNSFNFLMGEVMKLSQRRADFQVVRQVLTKLLKK